MKNDARKKSAETQKADGPFVAKKIFMKRACRRGMAKNAKRRILQKNKEMEKSSLFCKLFLTKKEGFAFLWRNYKIQEFGGEACAVIREQTEADQAAILSPFATRAECSKGRRRPEAPCPVRTCFARDRDRILHSNSFRRLKHKTQVFIAPNGDHFRQRMTHTLEVVQIARTIARALRLNEDLTEAIALGHDLAHTPFGHTGERVLNRLSRLGFAHNEQSLRVVEVLERDGRGLNLTWEVKDGIVNHRSRCKPHTPEGAVVRLADKIAYVNHDVQDAIWAGDLTAEDLPKHCLQALGDTNSRRINTLVVDVIEHSHDGVVQQSPAMAKIMADLRCVFV